MNNLEHLRAAERALLEIFYGIDAQVKHNLQRVLNAFVGIMGIFWGVRV